MNSIRWIVFVVKTLSLPAFAAFVGGLFINLAVRGGAFISNKTFEPDTLVAFTLFGMLIGLVLGAGIVAVILNKENGG